MSHTLNIEIQTAFVTGFFRRLPSSHISLHTNTHTPHGFCFTRHLFFVTCTTRIFLCFMARVAGLVVSGEDHVHHVASHDGHRLLFKLHVTCKFVVHKNKRWRSPADGASTVGPGIPTLLRLIKNYDKNAFFCTDVTSMTMCSPSQLTSVVLCNKQKKEQIDPKLSKKKKKML